MVNRSMYGTMLILCICLTEQVSAMYETAASKVIRLTSADFKKKVLDSDEAWLVEFYAPWCGHCK